MNIVLFIMIKFCVRRSENSNYSNNNLHYRKTMAHFVVTYLDIHYCIPGNTCAVNIHNSTKDSVMHA